MPLSIEAAYEEHLPPWFREHPFLRDGSKIENAVFESYLIAQAIARDVGAMRTSIEAKLKDSKYKPNPLMAEFYIDLVPPGEIRVEHVGYIYDSLLAGLGDASRMLFDFCGGQFSDASMSGTALAQFEFVNGDGTTRRTIDLSVDVDAASQLTLTRYLRDVTIDTGIDVTIGGRGDEYEVGPCVDIQCETLNIEASSLVVTSPRSDGPADFGVVLVANHCRSQVTSQPVVRSQLIVSWPGAEAYPWAKYSSSRTQQPNPMLAEAFRRFRRIGLALRSHKKGSLARIRDKIESEHVIGDGIGRSVLNRLVSDGILRLDGKFYHWETKRADELVGISWLQLHRSETSPKLASYLCSIVDRMG